MKRSDDRAYFTAMCYVQFSTDMDALELHLKLDKMDPALVPDSAIKHKNELYQKMTAAWTEVDGKGKQLIKDAAEVNRLYTTCPPSTQPGHLSVGSTMSTE